jgi:hypothetical protein
MMSDQPRVNVGWNDMDWHRGFVTRDDNGTHALVPWPEIERLQERIKPDAGWPSYSSEWVNGWHQGYKDCENGMLVPEEDV